METQPGTNMEFRYHAPCDICFTLEICKDTPSYKRLWALVSVFLSNISIPWVLISSAGISMSSEFIENIIFLYKEGIFFHTTFVFYETS